MKDVEISLEKSVLTLLVLREFMALSLEASVQLLLATKSCGLSAVSGFNPL